MKKRYELLAPVGNLAMLRAAIDAGADAVYLGLNEYTMRAAARNFSLKDLRNARELCDSEKNPQGKVKIYLTLNSIIYNKELKKIETTIKKVKPYVDAIICWDPAVITLCKKYKISFHLSTQASISNKASAQFYKNLGAERLILARELNLKQIKEISKLEGIEIECFAHGAMCVAVSGRCFTSQYIHRLSANRGKCAHPCRRTWHVKDEEGNELKVQNNRIFSAKDLCTLPFIEKMKKAGIKVFKIEGRNRTPEYVYNVVKIYRKALDKKLTHKEILQGIEELKKVYHRGFSSGFYIKTPTADDFSFSENGEQKEYKELVGRIEKWWPKAKAASLKMFTGNLRKGDKVYIISDETGVIKTEVKGIEKENKKVPTAKKGDEVGIKFTTKNKLKKGDEVYRIRTRNN